MDYSHLYFNNCFNQQFKTYDHIILNPPFSCNSTDDGTTEDIYGWRSMTKEQKFVIYQLQHLKDGGVGCCIIPRNNFNNSTARCNKFKKILMDNCQILKIIKCNQKLFMPVANVGCVICIFKKYTKEEDKKDYETVMVDYSDDGYVFKDKARIKQQEAKTKSYKTVLKFDDDWNYNDQPKIKIDIKDVYFEKLNKKFIVEYKKYSENFDYENLNRLIIKHQQDIKKLDDLKVKEWKQIKICDYFDVVKPKKIFKISQSETGDYPLISSTSMNNGITKYINGYSFDLPDCLTIARNGSVGYCFYQSGKFGITTDIIVVKLKTNKTLDLKLFSVLSTYYLTKKYNYSNKLSIDKLNSEIINYPVFV